VAGATLGEVQDAMAPGDVLLEFRRYRPLLAHESKPSEHWALLVVRGREAEPHLFDSGAVNGSVAAIQTLLTEQPGGNADAAAAALFAQLFGKVPPELLSDRRVWIAADGKLALLPFARLRLGDGRLWVNAAELRFIETGRQLLPRSGEPSSGSGLIAFGGIDFGSTPPQTTPAAPPGESGIVTAALQGGPQTQQATKTLRSSGLVFTPLPETAEEVDYLKGLYVSLRPREPAPRMLHDATASKAALIDLLSHHAPPRVLHLATHGFFMPDQSPIERPLLKAGVALAGANAGAQGILYAIEAQGLDLEGTELVALSACETAQGNIDYAEGVDGLVQAFHTAGARWTLVSLRKVGDHAAREFMGAFYEAWLAQPRSDPPAALLAVQRDWATSHDLIHADPANWDAWLLIEG
jgi:hypothetical protein